MIRKGGMDSKSNTPAMEIIRESVVNYTGHVGSVNSIRFASKTSSTGLVATGIYTYIYTYTYIHTHTHTYTH